VRSEVDAVVRRWGAEWAVPVDADSVATALGSSQWTGAVAPAESAQAMPSCVHHDDGLPGEIARLLFGESALGPVGVDVASAAAKALVTALEGRFGADGDPARASSTGSSLGHAGVCCTVAVGARELKVFLATSWLCKHGWLGRPARPAVAAWSPAKALAHIPLRLTVEIGRADLTVGDLSSIARDDVVLVNNASSEPIVIRVDDTDLQLRGFLGRQGSQRAVQFVSASKRTSA
jgi:flagellar motor switch/type III secretory pathway protein FliN